MTGPDIPAATAQREPGTARSDVLVVGAGPVGLVTALLLGRRGWQVTVLERWPEPYPRPRAVHFDDEVARLLADAGIGEELPRLTQPADIYEWRNGQQQTLLRFDWSGIGPSGWPMANMMHQPTLEATLADALARVPQVRLLRGYEAMTLTENADHVEVLARAEAGDLHHFSASWVIGCDGANSFVRTNWTSSSGGRAWPRRRGRSGQPSSASSPRRNRGSRIATNACLTALEFEHADVEGLKRLLTEDVLMEMPPMLNWFAGPGNYGLFMGWVFGQAGTRPRRPG